MSTPPTPTADHADPHPDTSPTPTTAQLARSVIASLIGIVAFFVPFTVAGTSSIPLDHIVTWIRETIPAAVPWVVLALVIGGAIVPFASGQWRRSTTDVVFSIAKVIGAVVGCLIVFDAMPGWLAAPGMGPFLWEKLVIPVGLLVPVGAIFLAMPSRTDGVVSARCDLYLPRLSVGRLTVLAKHLTNQGSFVDGQFVRQ